jgi:hypothetical protein
MKIDAKMLRHMIKEELTRDVEAQMNETGGYGSARGRAEGDENFNAAVQSLVDLMGVTAEKAAAAVTSLRGGGSAGETWHDQLNIDSPDGFSREAALEGEESHEGEVLDEDEVEVEGEVDEGGRFSRTGPDPDQALSIGAIMFLKGALGDSTWNEVGPVINGENLEDELMKLGKEDLIDAARRHNESVDGRSLVEEMEGHMGNVDEEAQDRSPVRESFNSNRLGHLAGILED